MTAIDDPRQLLRQALAQASRVVAAVRPDQLSGPTPCSEFDVRTLVRHMIFAARRTGEAGRREDTTEVEAAVSISSDEELAPSFEAAASAAVAAWDGSDALAGEIALSFGTFPAPVVVSIYLIEHVMHTWDLAVATGSSESLDDELAEVALEDARSMVPPDQFRGGPDMPFGSVLWIAEDAQAYDRLAAYLGRDPAARFAPAGEPH